MTATTPLQARASSLAAEHLERLGYEIVARDHRTRFGRIDLVAADATTLVFACVTAHRGRSTAPTSNVDDRARLQVRRMTRAYLADTPDRPRRGQLRHDAIEVELDPSDRLVALDHSEAAF